MAVSSSETDAPLDLAADRPAAVLIAAGSACLLTALMVAGRVLVPAWSPAPVLPIIFFVVTALAFYRHRWTRVHRPYGSRLPIYLAELIALVLLTRLAPFITAPGRLVEVLPSWLADPGAIFEGAFIVDALFVAMAWSTGHWLAAAIDQIHLQPGELPPPRGTPEFEHWERSAAAFDHRGAYRQLTYHIMGGGVLILAALTVAGGLGRAPADLLQQAVIATGLYFVCALLLLGWAHLSLLDTLWRLDGLRTPSLLARQWPVWLGLVVLVMAVLALLAPRTYAFDPIVLFVWLLQAAVAVVQLILFLVALPFLWLASLLGSAPPPSAPAAPVPPMLAGEARESGADLPFLATLRSIAFWAITLALAAYSVRVLLQSRWGALRLLPAAALWQGLVRLWQALLQGLRSGAATLTTAIRTATSGRAPVSGVLTHASRRARPRDARGLVLFLYLSLVERAGRRGLPRRRGMTATEYSRYLAARLAAQEAAGGAGEPAALTRTDLDTLTAAFLEARYSRHDVGESEVSRARQALQRLLARLRRATTRR